MVITWYGHSCFKIQSGDFVIVTDPFDKSIGLIPPRFKADIVMISHNHYDHANKETIPEEGRFLIEGPGEYEIKGVFIKGIETFHDKENGKERGLNTAYAINIEGIKICHLGDFGEEKLSPEILEQIGNVDILMIPVGGVYTIDSREASKIVNQIEPKIVIPMHYKMPNLKIKLEPVDLFLKEMGAVDKKPQDKLTIKKKDFAAGTETEVVVLKVG